MAEQRSDAVTSPPVLQKILPFMVALGTLAHLTFLLTEGPANSRFLQVGAVLGLLVFVATFVDIILGLAFLIAAIGFSPEMSMAGLDQIRLEDLILPGVLFAWLTRAAHRREPFAPARVKGPALAYLAVFTASSLGGVAFGTTSLRTAILYSFKFIEYFLILLVLAQNVRTLSEFKALVIFTILVAVGGAILEWDRTVLGFIGGESGRVQGPAGETANIFGGYLTLVLSILVGLYLHAQSGLHRLAAGAGIIILGRALLYTYSRTSYAAFVFALVVFGVFKAPRLLLILAIVTVLFPILAPEAVLNRASTITGIIAGAGPASWEARTYAWEGYVGRLAGGEFLLGRGLGSVRMGDVDSEYIRIIVDTGILGLAAFFWFLARLGRVAHGTYEALPRSTFAKGYASGFLIAFLAIAVHAVAATSFSAIRTMECFMVLTGLMIALANRAEEWGVTRAPEAGSPKPQA